jgi:predicted nuclease of predicted toxin-antitoxin system
MKFLVDMPLSPRLAKWLTEHGHDAVHVSDVGMERARDEEILGLAAKEKRVLVTADLDYPRLLAIVESEGPGLVLFRGGNYSEEEARERLRRALEAISHEDFPTSICVIEKHRIRRRRLPIGG